MENSQIANMQNSPADREFEELLARYEPLLLSSVARYAPTYCGMTRDELVQEAIFAFYRAVCTFDRERSIGFGHYAGICIQNALISVYRSYKRRNDRCIAEYFSEDRFPTDGLLSGTEDPMQTTIVKEELQTALALILPLLSAFELRVFRMYAENKKADVIASSMGVSLRSVQNAIDRIKRKFRHHYHVHMPR